VVDDNSPDGTQEVALELQRAYGEHRVVGVPVYFRRYLVLDAIYLCAGT
jgi:hypothetical protein